MAPSTASLSGYLRCGDVLGTRMANWQRLIRGELMGKWCGEWCAGYSVGMGCGILDTLYSAVWIWAVVS